MVAADRSKARLALVPNGLVSVVIPVFNGEKFLVEAIESVRAQTYEPIETIVVDDASTDRSADGRGGCGATPRQAPENGGCGAARNSGIAQAKGDCITILDCDDVMKPDRVAKQVEAIRSGADFVFSRFEKVIPPGVEVPQYVGAKRAPISDGRETYGSTSWLATREAVDRIGPFDETLRYGEDVDYCLRANEAGIEIAYLDEALTERRIHGANMVYDFQSARRATFDAFKRRIDRKRAGEA